MISSSSRRPRSRFLLLVLLVLYCILSLTSLRSNPNYFTVAAAAAQLLLESLPIPLTTRRRRLLLRRGIRLSAMCYLSPAHLRRRRRRRAGGRATLTCSRSFPLLLLASFVRSFAHSPRLDGRTDGRTAATTDGVFVLGRSFLVPSTPSSFSLPPAFPVPSPFTHPRHHPPHRTVHHARIYIHDSPLTAPHGSVLPPPPSLARLPPPLPHSRQRMPSPPRWTDSEEKKSHTMTGEGGE